MSDTLTVREVAARLGISVSTIQRRRRASVFPLRPVNSGLTVKLLFAKADVDRLLEHRLKQK